MRFSFTFFLVSKSISFDWFHSLKLLHFMLISFTFLSWNVQEKTQNKVRLTVIFIQLKDITQQMMAIIIKYDLHLWVNQDTNNIYFANKIKAKQDKKSFNKIFSNPWPVSVCLLYVQKRQRCWCCMSYNFSAFFVELNENMHYWTLKPLWKGISKGYM